MSLYRILFCSLCFMTAMPCGTYAQQPGAAPVEKEHAFLNRFSGQWTTESEGSMGEGQPPMKCKGTMSSHMLGALWIVNELKGDMAGTPMSGLQTIGYDPVKKKYIGTWVDNMMNHLWQYEGTVDAAGKQLTLEADGPSFVEEGKTARYRDAYEFKSDDHIVATSSVQSKDGKWTIFMTGNIKRASPTSKAK
jgi:hypothetical protein